MQDSFAKVEELAAHIKEYIHIRIAAVKLSTAEKTSKIIANLLAVVIVVVIFLFFLLFLSLAAAYALAKWTGAFYWGFLLVAVLYLVAGIVVWKMRERILRFPILNALLQQFFNEESHED
ncbi:MAG TPA: phage holin family protein [Chitinophagaceae bacterium]|nr:phage holin family protein [Chitinophagaceae bacterium]